MAAAGFQLTISAVDKATAVAKRVNDSIAKITKPVNDVKSSVAAFNKETGLDQLGKRFESVGKSAASVARGVASIAPPLAAIVGVGSIAGIAAFATSWGKAATEIANTSSVLGVSTTNLQRYRGAARVAGLSADTMTSSMQALGSAFEDASAGRNTFAQGVMNSMGITQHRLKDGSIDVIRGINDVANAAKKFTNTEAQRKFLDIFGMGGLQAMIRRGTIGQFVAQFDKLHATMSPEQIANGEKFNQSLIALDFSVDKLKNSIGSSLAPAVGRAVDQFARLADQYGPKIAAWIDNVDWDKTASSIADVANALGGAKGVAIALAAVSFAGPISGVLSLTTSLVKLTAIVVPSAIAALGTLGTAGIAAWAALKVAKLAGLPDVDSKQGVDDVRKGDWLAASAHLSIGDFARALAARASGKSDEEIAGLLRSGDNPAGKGAPLGIRSNNPLNILDKDKNEIAYATPEEGIASAVDNLRRGYRGLSLAAIADKWTGGARTGNTPEQMANYVGLLSSGTGLSADQVPDLDNPSVVSGLLKAQIRAENGIQPYSDDQFAAAMSRSRLASLYPGNSDSAAAGAAVGAGTGAQNATPSGLRGHLEITLHMPNAPQGTRATVHSNGNVLATGQIGHSMLLGPNV